MTIPVSPYDAAYRTLTSGGISPDAADGLLRDLPADGLTALAALPDIHADPVGYLADLDVRSLAGLLRVDAQRGHAIRFGQTCRAVRS